MDVEEALKFVDSAVFATTEKHLNDAEATVVRGAWEGKTYGEMAKTSKYELNYLMRDIGPKLCKIMSEALGEEVTKSNFRAALERQWLKQSKQVRETQPPKPSDLEEKIEDETSKKLNSGLHDELSVKEPPSWGEAPDISVFYGRTEELAILEKWIIKDNCRLIALLGMPGIGKTSIALKLAHQIQDKFEYVIWRNLRNAPPLQEFLVDLLKILSHSSEFDLPKNADEGILRLIGYLRKHRSLLLLDGVETILRSGDRFGRYNKGYEGYGILLRRIGEEQHQSCLVVSSQEKPGEIVRLESSRRPVRSLQLEGLNSEEAKKILQEKGLTGEQSWEDLIQLYRGNPLTLKLVAATIENVFDKDVAKFIKLGTTVLSPDYRELLDEQFKRLSDLEKEVMQYLATGNTPISFDKLRDNMPATLAASELIEALESLGRRSLIEKSPNKDTNELLFTVQPVVKKYVQKYFPLAR